MAVGSINVTKTKTQANQDKKETYFCPKCRQTLKATEFYASRDKEKYPSGHFDLCKKCLTMHVDNWDPNTYLWILQEADVPYIPEEWNKLMRNYAVDASKVTGTTIIGRYIGKMYMSQYNKYRWADSEFLQKLSDAKTIEALERAGRTQQEIDWALKSGPLRVGVDVDLSKVSRPEMIAAGTYIGIPSPPSALPDTPNVQYSMGMVLDEEDTKLLEEMDLTEEDKTYLKLKWGKAYNPLEWVQLEKLYNEMLESYDIQSAGHIDTLKLVCKTSLKANQLLDQGDVDAAKKMVAMYDGLMKSGKFTAAQNKAEKGEYIDSISELVELAEKQGFIPQYYVDGPNDRVDETLLDLKTYTKNLVVEEMNLGNLIESAVKQMAEQENRKEDEDIDDDLMNYDYEQEILPEDYEDYDDFLDEQEAADADLIMSLLDKEE